MHRNTLIFLTALLYLLSASGCSQKRHKTENAVGAAGDTVIGGVPFIRQKDDFCGPAAMASVMAYYGNIVSQEEIAGRVYTPALKGALISDMENFARERGFEVSTGNGNIEQLKTFIDEQVPVILLVDRGRWGLSVPHYYVLYGYLEDTFIIHSGFKGDRRISPGKLDSEWKRMNRLMLVLRK